MRHRKGRRNFKYLKSPILSKPLLRDEVILRCKQQLVDFVIEPMIGINPAINWNYINIKRCVNRMYKHHMHQRLSYKHLRFAQHLTPKKEFIMTGPPKIVGGSHMRYKSSCILNFINKEKKLGGNSNG